MSDANTERPSGAWATPRRAIRHAGHPVTSRPSKTIEPPLGAHQPRRQHARRSTCPPRSNRLSARRRALGDRQRDAERAPGTARRRRPRRAARGAAWEGPGAACAAAPHAAGAAGPGGDAPAPPEGARGRRGGPRGPRSPGRSARRRSGGRNRGRGDAASRRRPSRGRARRGGPPHRVCADPVEDRERARRVRLGRDPTRARRASGAAAHRRAPGRVRRGARGQGSTPRRGRRPRSRGRRAARISSVSRRSWALGRPTPSRSFQSRPFPPRTRSVTRTCSRGVMPANSSSRWNVRPIPSLVRRNVGRRSIAIPSKETDPVSGRTRPSRQLKRVVLPAPFGPTRPTASPSSIDTESRFRATIPPKLFEMSRATRGPRVSAPRGSNRHRLAARVGRCA